MPNSLVIIQPDEFSFFLFYRNNQLTRPPKKDDLRESKANGSAATPRETPLQLVITWKVLWLICTLYTSCQTVITCRGLSLQHCNNITLTDFLHIPNSALVSTHNLLLSFFFFFFPSVERRKLQYQPHRTVLMLN